LEKKQMRFLTFERNGLPCLGVRDGASIIDLSAAPAVPQSLQSLIEGSESALAAARTAVARAGKNARQDASAIRFLPPVPRPGKITCVGLNYTDHLAEAGIKERPKFPGMFHRVSTSIVGHGQPILRPSNSEQLDFEGELLVVMGKRARHVSAVEALRHVFGYSIFNDGSVRDYQQLKALAAGKNFDSSGAFGPEVVTVDELPPGASGLHLQTRLNGAVMQDNNTSNLVFNVAQIIELISGFSTLEPGDVISTGTCGGVGAARKPPVWMKDGDTIEIEIEKIGILRNPVRNESLQ
jgi:acylpyruvate hydrolase